MQNPNEDTEWNDVLRSKGILAPKQSQEATIDEDTLVKVRCPTELQVTSYKKVQNMLYIYTRCPGQGPRNTG